MDLTGLGATSRGENLLHAPFEAGSLAADVIVDAVAGKGSVRMDAVLYNTPFYLTLTFHDPNLPQCTCIC